MKSSLYGTKMIGRFSRLKSILLNPKDNTKSFVHQKVPYYSQWASRDLFEPSKKRRSLEDDPRWKGSGASNLSEYIFWANNICGMACLQSILDYKFGKTPKIIDLAKKATEYGAYVIKGDDVDGLIYKPFVEFIDKECGLKAKVMPHLSIEKIVKEIQNENLVIASVNDKIRYPEKEFHGKKGGHLILVLGVDQQNKTFLIHNPSGYTKESQEYAPIKFHDFKKFFANRGIIVY